MEDHSDIKLAELAMRIGKALCLRGARLVTAESCTGGWVAQVMTQLAGSSQWFDRGFVTYSNSAKHEMLGVESQTLENFGAVSEETARAMASGALSRSQADFSIAVSGIAGPVGGTPDKPVGTVCFAFAVKKHPVYSSTVHLAGDRASIRRQAVIAGLSGLLETIETSNPETI